MGHRLKSDKMCAEAVYPIITSQCNLVVLYYYQIFGNECFASLQNVVHKKKHAANAGTNKK